MIIRLRGEKGQYRVNVTPSETFKSMIEKVKNLK